MSDATQLIEIDTPTGRYPVHIEAGAIRTLAKCLDAAGLRRRVHLIADPRVWAIHGDEVTHALRNQNVRFTLSTIAGGEESKSLPGLSSLLHDLAGAEHQRDDPIVALGGGVTSDLAGFAATIWLRGVPWVCCPTSLEAAIDAGIGGKTGINLPEGKNLVGAFHHPIAVLIDLSLMATLPHRDHVAALAESVKHAIVAKSEFLAWQHDRADAILNRDPDVLRDLIATNIRIKADIVSADERERATDDVGRAALNLGHTVGHALEAIPDQHLRHGESVALGLRAALSIAASELQFPQRERAAVTALLDRFGLPTVAPMPFDPAEILNRMRMDKKVREDRVRFVLPRRMGQLEWWIADNTAPVLRALAEINPTAR